MKDKIVLMSTVSAIFADDKGILAADESNTTIEKRFAKAGIENTEDNRRAYRELLFTTPSIEEFISGVIMYEETIHQATDDGRAFVDLLKSVNILPGIKVDLGTVPMTASPKEKITKGLDGLQARLSEFSKLGAKFAKWRAVITIDDAFPTDANIRQNAKDLAAYASLCQDADIVPIIEPEVLMDGAHDIARCKDVSEKVLTYVFEELKAANVLIEGVVLKTNMITPGAQSPQRKKPEDIAEATVSLFRKVLPQGLAGVVFLSGGQGEIQATENLQAMNDLPDLPWKLSFSYGRALQDSALLAWKGSAENVSAAQDAFYHRAQMNSFAAAGIYSSDTENA